MFNPGNWYWVVAGSATQVYSSAAGAYVPVADATYVAWLAADPRNLPTKIAVEQDLWDTLQRLGMPLPASATTSDAAKTTLINQQVLLVVGQVLFNHENRIRALESKAPITKAQFIAGVKALLQ